VASAALVSAIGAGQAETNRTARRAARSTFLDLMREPDGVRAFAGLEQPMRLERSASGWQGARRVTVTASVAHENGGTLKIQLASPELEVTHVHLRWNTAVAANLKVLGDAWERSYGDLGWRDLVPERVMPWYFATSDGTACHVYGVMTAPRALCFWQMDQEGISLWLNVQNGGSGVVLGERTLDCATVVVREGVAGEDSFEAVRAFCRKSCSRPVRPVGPLYGTNNWYYAYGRNTAAQILRDTELVASLAGDAKTRPFSVIDMGWDAGAPAFPDMGELAREIKAKHARPGIWMRPLKSASDAAESLLLPAKRFADAKTAQENAAYDPTLPEVQKLVTERVQQLTGWGYELVKHDFSTFDLLGQWGFEMGASPTRAGWALHDRSKTNAEVIADLYALIRQAAGKATIILGCNTIGHLAQGLFEAQRTGDDTSGRIWERTRRMGINTLAFRMPQHGVYFAQDADCVGITRDIPWEKNRQWLDVLARSGTALFLSPEPGSIGPEQKAAIAEAFAVTAAAVDVEAHATDWFESTTPQKWGHGAAEKTYDWCGADGAYPFTV